MFNPRKLTKAEIIERFDFKCEHGHNGLEHSACFEESQLKVMRVGSLDIEASGLKANFNYMLCIVPETLVLTADLRWVRADSFKIGDTIIGINEYPVSHKKGEKRYLLRTNIENIDTIIRPRIRVVTDLGEIVVSDEHRFLWYSTHTGGYVWRAANKLNIGDDIRYCVSPWSIENLWAAGWLAGIADGEGSISRRNKRGMAGIAISQSTKQGFDKEIETALREKKYRFYKDILKTQVVNFNLWGGEALRFLGQERPKRLLKKFEEALNSGKIGLPRLPAYAKIKSIEDVGEGPVITLKTSTKTLITNGFVSHNSWCIKELNGKIVSDIITTEDIRTGVFDKRIVRSCVEEMRKYHKLLTHYGTGFDVKFLRTRALIHKLDFPKFGEIIHSDVYYMAKRALLLHSNRQDCVTEALYGKSHKTRIHPEIWMAVTRGDKKALQYLLKHNEIDVKELEKNYLKLRDYVRETKKSI